MNLVVWSSAATAVGCLLVLGWIVVDVRRQGDRVTGRWVGQMAAALCVATLVAAGLALVLSPALR